MQLVMVHGAGGSGLSFYYQVSALPGADAMDLPGHPRGKPCPTIEEYVQWLRGYIAGRGYSDVVLAGHSMGGAIAMLYALEHSEDLKGLVLMSTGARLRVDPNQLRFLKERAPRDMDTWLRQREEGLSKVAPQVRELLLQRSREVGPLVQLNDLLACDRFDVMERVGEIRVPTLVWYGTEDTLTLPRYGEYLASHIPGARAMVVKGATHQAHLECPDQANAAIKEFLATLGGAGASRPGHGAR
ncbi:MAG: alpha/beta hydrolase [Chloroflexi bacterium]|nr:alpha/beta hydrolase [Chloroflexota bacterium]